MGTPEFVVGQRAGSNLGTPETPCWYVTEAGLGRTEPFVGRVYDNSG